MAGRTGRTRHIQLDEGAWSHVPWDNASHKNNRHRNCCCPSSYTNPADTTTEQGRAARGHLSHSTPAKAGLKLTCVTRVCPTLLDNSGDSHLRPNACLSFFQDRFANA